MTHPPDIGGPPGPTGLWWDKRGWPDVEDVGGLVGIAVWVSAEELAAVVAQGNERVDLAHGQQTCLA